jgi:hypothetical protein
MNNNIYDYYNFDNYLKLINVDKIYKLEDIMDFENDFGVKLGFYNKSNYSTTSYKNFFNQEIISFVQDYYKNDFLVFNYSFDFNLSINQKFMYT